MVKIFQSKVVKVTGFSMGELIGLRFYLCTEPGISWPIRLRHEG
jgi:hypothetical protein